MKLPVLSDSHRHDEKLIDIITEHQDCDPSPANNERDVLICS